MRISTASKGIWKIDLVASETRGLDARGPIAEEIINLLHDLVGKLGKNFQALDVVYDLLGTRGTGDDRCDVLVLQAPGESEMGDLAVKSLCNGLWKGILEELNHGKKKKETREASIPSTSGPSQLWQPMRDRRTSSSAQQRLPPLKQRI